MALSLSQATHTLMPKHAIAQVALVGSSNRICIANSFLAGRTKATSVE
jgi:hypothetical protein